MKQTDKKKKYCMTPFMSVTLQFIIRNIYLVFNHCSYNIALEALVISYVRITGVSLKKKENFVYYIGVEPINNIVLISSEQRRNPVTHVHVPILPSRPGCM